MPNRLNNTVVRHARILAAEGVAPVRIAERFGVDAAKLTDAIRGVSFMHLDNPAPVPSGEAGGRTVAASGALDGTRLRSIRQKLGLSQAAFAVRIRLAGHELGEPNRCTKRLVQKWEAGEHSMPLPRYRGALVRVTGHSIETLCLPILPPNAVEAAARLAELIPAVSDLYYKVIELHGYLTREPSPLMGEEIDPVGDVGRMEEPE